MPEIGEIQNLDQDAAILRDMQKKRQKQPVAAKNGKTPLVRKSGYDALDKNSFLKLLVTQLSKQDPTNPMNDREFISQMAQFSSLEQMNNVANSMNKLRGTQASQLIGKMVTGKDFVTEKPLQGIVTSAIYEPNGDVLLKVGGRFTKFDDVSSVTEVTPAAAPMPQPVGANVSRETSLTPGPSPSGRGEAVGGVRAVTPQVNPAQAAQAYEANQKTADKPAAPAAAQPGAAPTTQINKTEVSKGE